MITKPTKYDFSVEYVSKQARSLKENGKTIVTTNGCFDILHAGHIDTLVGAKSYGDFLIVLINSDLSVQSLKGSLRPILNEENRAILISSLKMVDAVAIFEENTPLLALEAIKPHVHIKGGSFLEERIQAESLLLSSWGGELKTLPLREGISTTDIIKKIIKSYSLEN